MPTARPRTYVWRWDLPAPPAELWPRVADTDRFNRDTGLPRVEDARAPGEEPLPGHRLLRIRVLGVPVEWEEHPFEWVAPTRFGVVRRYRRGPVREMHVRVELEPLGTDRTRLTYRVDAWARGALGALAIPVQIGWISRRAFGRAFRRYAEEARRSAAGATGAAGRTDGGSPGVGTERRAGGRSDGRPGAQDGARLRALARRLVEGGQPAGPVARLCAFLDSTDEMELRRIRPYALADAWSEDRHAVLALLLAAARAGVLDLRWEVVCPLCLGARDTSAGLEDLPAGVHCETCGVDVDADLERSVELVFVPAPGIRTVGTGAYCVAGPRTTPHVVAQQRLAPGERRDFVLALEPGRYRVRGLDGRRSAWFEVAADGAERVEAEVDPDALRLTAATVRPDASFALANRCADDQLVLVDRNRWGDDAATAAHMMVLHEFRDLFSREVLAAGRTAGVGTVTILFTDLKGSTALYRQLGDGPAFDLVADHFRLLREAIQPERGSVVKTIGDAVMAAFLDPSAAVRAVLRAHAELARREGAPLVLKAGLHSGPCIAVTLNERLDYFGSTVNVASRLADLSEGGDLVMTDAVRDDPAASAALVAAGLEPAEFRAALRGIEGEARLWRVRTGR